MFLRRLVTAIVRIHAIVTTVEVEGLYIDVLGDVPDEFDITCCWLRLIHINPQSTSSTCEGHNLRTERCVWHVKIHHVPSRISVSRPEYMQWKCLSCRGAIHGGCRRGARASHPLTSGRDLDMFLQTNANVLDDDVEETYASVQP